MPGTITPIQWAAALEGDFRQCRQTLTEIVKLPDGTVQESHCCLGVYAVTDGWERTVQTLPSTNNQGEEVEQLQVVYKPDDNTTVVTALSGHSPMGQRLESVFIALNDTLDFTFEQIAGVVRLVFDPLDWKLRDDLTVVILEAAIAACKAGGLSGSSAYPVLMGFIRYIAERAA